MRSPRFSLRSLMGVVFFCGVALASLRFASDLWASVVFSVAVCLILVSIVGVVLRRGRARAGWVGFVVFGCGYLILSFGPWFGGAITPPPFLTTSLLDLLYPRVYPIPPQPAVTQGWVVNQPAVSEAWEASAPPTVQASTASQLVSLVPMTAPFPRSPSRDNFVRVSHSLLAIVAALIGAVLARALFARREDAADTEPRSDRSPA